MARNEKHKIIDSAYSIFLFEGRFRTRPPCLYFNSGYNHTPHTKQFSKTSCVYLLTNNNIKLYITWYPTEPTKHQLQNTLLLHNSKADYSPSPQPRQPQQDLPSSSRSARPRRSCLPGVLSSPSARIRFAAARMRN